MYRIYLQAGFLSLGWEAGLWRIPSGGGKHTRHTSPLFSDQINAKSLKNYFCRPSTQKILVHRLCPKNKKKKTGIANLSFENLHF